MASRLRARPDDRQPGLIEPDQTRVCGVDEAGRGPLAGPVFAAAVILNPARPIAGLRDGLVALERRFPTPREAAWQTTVVPTIVTGGDAENRLPERVRLRLDIRHIAADTPAAIIAGVRDAFPGAEVLGAPIAGGLLDTDPSHPMLAPLMAAITGVTGQPTRFMREHYGSDARFYSDAGMPAVCFGPVGDGLHSDDEWVDIDSLMQFFAITRRHVLHDTSEES